MKLDLTFVDMDKEAQIIKANDPEVGMVTISFPYYDSSTANMEIRDCNGKLLKQAAVSPRESWNHFVSLCKTYGSVLGITAHEVENPR